MPWSSSLASNFWSWKYGLFTVIPLQALSPNQALMTLHPQESNVQKKTLQSFSKILRRIQILFPTVSITSQLKCPIITRKPLLTPLKFTVFLANLVSIYLMPANLVKSPNPQFLTALLLYMGQMLNPVSNL